MSVSSTTNEMTWSPFCYTCMIITVVTLQYLPEQARTSIGQPRMPWIRVKWQARLRQLMDYGAPENVPWSNSEIFATVFRSCIRWNFEISSIALFEGKYLSKTGVVLPDCHWFPNVMRAESVNSWNWSLSRREPALPYNQNKTKRWPLNI